MITYQGAGLTERIIEKLIVWTFLHPHSVGRICPRFEAGILALSARSAHFYIGWVSVSDSTPGSYQVGRISSFRDIERSSLCTGASGTGTQGADSLQHQLRDGNFGNGNLRRTWKEIEKHSRNCKKLDGLCLSYGSVR